MFDECLFQSPLRQAMVWKPGRDNSQCLLEVGNNNMALDKLGQSITSHLARLAATYMGLFWPLQTCTKARLGIDAECLFEPFCATQSNGV
jgi:hypothetical protein